MRGNHCIRAIFTAGLGLAVLAGLWLSGQAGGPRGTVRFDRCPPQAQVDLDGSWIGDVPPSGVFEVAGLPAGDFRFTFARAGRRLAVIPVRLSEGENRRISYTLGTPSVQPAGSSLPGSTAAARSSVGVPPAPVAGPLTMFPETSSPPTVDPSPRADPAAPGPDPEAPPSLAPLAVALGFSLLVFAVSFLLRRPRHPAPETSSPPHAGSPFPDENTDSSDPATPDFMEAIRWRESLHARGFVRARPAGGQGPIIDVEESPHEDR